MLTKRIFLFLLIYLILPISARAACTGSSPTWTTTPDKASVASCASQVIAGDTVNISAGSATWTSQIVFTVPIHLHGAGANDSGTVITASNVNDPLKFTPALCSVNLEVDGIKFIDSGGATGNDPEGIIFISGTCSKLLVHDNALHHVNYNGSGKSRRQNFVSVNGYVYGVIYRNTVDDDSSTNYTQTSGRLFTAYEPTWGGNGADFGDGSFLEGPNYVNHDPLVPGYDDSRFLYIEGNSVTNTVRTGCSDENKGTRSVERYNTLSYCSPNSHGFDTSARDRAVRLKLVYGNIIIGPTSHPTCIENRGGSGMNYGNQFTGWQSAKCIQAFAYRFDNGNGNGASLANSSGGKNYGLCWPYSTSDNYAAPASWGGNVYDYEGEHYACLNSVGGSQRCCTGPQTGTNPVTPAGLNGTTISSPCVTGDDSNNYGCGAGNPCVGPLDNTDGSGAGPELGTERWCRDGIGRGAEISSGCASYTASGNISAFGCNQSSEPLYIFGNTSTTYGAVDVSLKDAVVNSDVFGDTISTAPNKVHVGTSLPGTCTNGDRYWDSTNRNLNLCGASNNYTVLYQERVCPDPRTGLTGSCNHLIPGKDGYNTSQANPTHTITASAGAGGTITPTGTISNVGDGSNLTFIACPTTGAVNYQVASITVDSTPVTSTPDASLCATGQAYTLTNITADHTVAATFTAISETKASAGYDANGGTMKLDANGKTIH